MPNEELKPVTAEDLKNDYGYPPFNPFEWNEMYLSEMKKGTTKNGNMKHVLIFSAKKGSGNIQHNINYDADGKMMFASQHNKILNALVQGKEKSIAEAIAKAKGNKDITIFMKCEMNGDYMNVGEVKQKLSAEDQMNDVLAKSVEKGKADDKDDDLPM